LLDYDESAFIIGGG